MAEQPSDERLVEIVVRLLADAAYIFVEPAAALQDSSDSLLVSCIELRSDEPWNLVVAVERRFGDALAANFLGIDDGSPDADAAAADAVGELSNMLAGALSAELQASGAPCSIGLPKVTVEPVADVAARAQNCARKVFLAAEVEGRLLVGLERGRTA